MSLMKIANACLVLSLAALVSGCFGGGGDSSRTASKGRFGTKDAAAKKQTAQRGRAQPSDLNEINPETSMRQGYEILKEREAQQMRVVQEMRQAIAQGEDAVRREQIKLDGIRSQLAEFDLAMRRYEDAPRQRPAYGAPTRGDVVPTSMYAERGAPRPESRSREPRAERASYQPDPRASRDPRPREYAPPRDDRPAAREQVLYNPQDRREYDRAAPDPRGDPRYRQDPYPVSGQESGAGGWETPGNLYGGSNAQPGPRPAHRNTLRPEPVRTAAPVQAPRPAPEAALRPGTPPPPAPAQRQAPQEPAPRTSGTDDDVFTPDLYLSGNR